MGRVDDALETELLALFPPRMPSVRGLNRFQRQFVSDREVILVLDDTLPGAGRDAVFQKLRPALAALPGMSRSEASGGEWLKAAPQLAAWPMWNLEPGAVHARRCASGRGGAREAR